MEKNIKEEFISTLSHEIRTPLTSIKGFSQTMLSSWDKINDDKKKEFLEIILNQSKRLINLVENVLNVAKIDSDSQSLILTKVDINNILESCVNLVKISNKEFNFNIIKSKNSIYSLCDNEKIQQILLNLLDNAMKYSLNSNNIDIVTKNEGEYNTIAIKNYGNYIKEENYCQIFDKFYRLETYKNSTTQGSGLGLYIVKTLLDKMQGKIEVKSNVEEKYVQFKIYIPIYEVEKLTQHIGV